MQQNDDAKQDEGSDSLLTGELDTQKNSFMNNESASSRKIETILCSTPSSSEPITGYRFIDTEILNNVIANLLCSECMTSSLSLSESTTNKKGLASCLYVKCLSCGYSHQFFTSKSKDNSVDINSRAVYAMLLLIKTINFTTRIALLDQIVGAGLIATNSIIRQHTNQDLVFLFQ